MRIGSRMLSRRLVVVICVTGTFLGGLLVLSSKAGELCPDSRYCTSLSDMRFAAPPLQEVTDIEKGLVMDTGPPPVVSPPKEGVQPVQPAQPVADVIDVAPQTTNETQTAGSHDQDDATICAGFPDTSNILVVMKTGASEAYNKIPTQVLTNLKCLDSTFLFFSDMAQTVAGYEIHDSLDTVSPAVMRGNDDFVLYFRQASCTVDQETCNKDTDAGSQAWALDKYKNVHVAEKTYAMQPGFDWYIFIDADTYVLWGTMVPWLKSLRPSDKHYLGSAALYGDLAFAHGGSGYVLSQAAMREMFEGKKEVANRWDEAASENCCGDVVFAMAVQEETGVWVNNMWPTVNGEKPYTLMYGEEQWCQPIATMHHVGSEEVSDFDAFEESRGYAQPMRIKEIFHQFVELGLKEFRLDWDNMSGDILYLNASSGAHSEEDIERARSGNDMSELEKDAHLSFHDCRLACLEFDDCYQFLYHDEMCVLNEKFGHGRPAPWDEDSPKSERMMSGWNVERIRKWVAANKDCGPLQWPVM